MDGIEAIAGELYGLPPEEFTAARNGRAASLKADGEADLAAVVRTLRKPTVGAWLLNQLVRRHPDEVEQLFDLGERLRAAQGTLGAAELRALGEQRRRLTRAVAEQAAGIGRETGRTVSAQVVADVEETLRSAMVDPAAGEALATGLLVDTFTSTGLEPVDLSGALALDTGVRPPGSGRPGRDVRHADPDAERRRREEIAAAHHAVEEAERAAERAGRECELARARAVELARHREDLASDIETLRRRLAEMEQRLSTAVDAETAARRDQVAATRAERSAIESVEQARRRLRSLGGPDST